MSTTHDDLNTDGAVAAGTSVTAGTAVTAGTSVRAATAIVAGTYSSATDFYGSAARFTLTGEISLGNRLFRIYDDFYGTFVQRKFYNGAFLAV